MRASRWLAPLVAVFVLVTACSDDGDDRSDPARSSRAPTSTTEPDETTTPPENATCALVTTADLEAVFDGPPEDRSSTVVDGDTVCRWEAGDQVLEFRLHEGSSLTQITRDGALVVTEQRARNGRVYGFRYVADSGDLDASRAAVNDLADSVIGRAE